MNISSRDEAGATILRCEGRLTMVTAPDLRAAVERATAVGRPRVVLDMSGTSFVDSSGLGALIGSLKTARKAGGDLRIAEVSDQVMTVLRLTNLDRVLQTHSSVLDACRDW